MTRPRDFIGPYQLARLIRVGNTCQVWEAIKDSDQQRYALKILRPDQKGNREEVGFMKHEVEVGQQLKHPNIIKMLEFNTSEHTPFVVMELYDAQNLKQELRDQTERLAYLTQEAIRQAAEALTYMHAEGWIHCDIKPDNFLVNRTGFVKMIDFAISQRIKQGFLSRFNMFRKVRGTRSYMSPEQIRNKNLDERTDVYSFGCVVFELLAGRPPFKGDSTDDLLNRHLHAGIPSILVYNENVTSEMNDLVRRMIAKKREHRPPSMWEFLKEYRAMRVYHNPPPRPGSMMVKKD